MKQETITYACWSDQSKICGKRTCHSRRRGYFWSLEPHGRTADDRLVHTRTDRKNRRPAKCGIICQLLSVCQMCPGLPGGRGRQLWSAQTLSLCSNRHGPDRSARTLALHHL